MGLKCPSDRCPEDLPAPACCLGVRDSVGCVQLPTSGPDRAHSPRSEATPPSTLSRKSCRRQTSRGRPATLAGCVAFRCVSTAA